MQSYFVCCRIYPHMQEMLPQPSHGKNPLLSEVEGSGWLIFMSIVQYVDVVDSDWFGFFLYCTFCILVLNLQSNYTTQISPRLQN